MFFENITAQLNTEKAVAEILSNFNSNFIIDVVQDNIRTKFRPYNTGSVNYPVVLESDFNRIKITNPSYQDEIENVRLETYREIIGAICNHYQLQYVGEDQSDVEPDQLYSTANLMYEIFISSFTKRMVHFFVQYIINNLDSFYNQLEASGESKKGRESTSYGKIIYTDQKLLTIHGNMNQVIDILASLDISFSTLLSYICDRPLANFLSSVLVDTNDIYKYHYASYLKNPNTRPDMFTAITLSIQANNSQAHQVPVIPGSKEVKDV